jgi:hypothetical protein
MSLFFIAAKVVKPFEISKKQISESTLKSGISAVFIKTTELSECSVFSTS